ncbi:MAG TPA: DUF1631 family protein [Caldimonas sp.]|jgi:hypothetical protein|nr:DUF1631 family protein [Caldimonas sp.]HEX4233235.1 DUF1631 family protein [Caldimonas sp.]
MNLIEPRAQATLDAAIQLIRDAVASAAMRVAESLNAQAQTAIKIAERDQLIVTLQELRRNLGSYQNAFLEALREKVAKELAPRTDAKRKLESADWQTLSLVDEKEVEEQMNFVRLGQMISHECEWQLRELAAYMGALLNVGRADDERNPLRAEIVGAALHRGIEAISGERESRRILARELGQAVAHAMPACYDDVLRLFQERGVRPVNLTVRTVEGPGNQLGAANSGYASLPRDGAHSSRGGGYGEIESGPGSDMDLLAAHRRALATAFPGRSEPVESIRDPLHSSGGYSRPRAREAADQQLMTLLRRLTAISSQPGELGPASLLGGPGGALSRSQPSAARPSGYASSRHAGPTSGSDKGVISSRSGLGDSMRAAPGADPAYGEGLTGLMAVNLIRAHREELIQASTGKLDHMVIDVVGSLFDQILSDSRVPPQMAREIARLQLPVLRVALSDQTFFSTRRHPVRRFINRIASLANAFDDFDIGPGAKFLTRVRKLVDEIVEGDFDQIELYAAKVAELEQFIAEQSEGAVEKSGATVVLDQKESELRIQQRYMQQLQAALVPMQLPSYMLEFLAQVWSQALVLAVRDGADSDRARRYRRVGVDLVMSIQPKGSPMFRKKFLIQLPPLMKDLNEGMKLIGWPESAQREFFSKLLPAHAESLKGQPLSELDHNLLVKQLEAVFAMPVPVTVDGFARAEPIAEVAPEAIERRFTPEEAKQVGLINEAAVDWSAAVATAGVDVDLGELQPPAPASPSLVGKLDSAAVEQLGPTTTELGEAPEPDRGAQLMDHIKLGFAYQMHLKNEWQKVQLAHVSAGRSFFVFTRGGKHQETISMTARMLSRMCETGRFRAVESAYLMERATLRARKQLAALGAPTKH